ncbi:hypothetical protein RDABS01_032423 [Bienertia sinuspersici]
MKCQEVIKVEPLMKDKAWELFARVLGREIKLHQKAYGLAKLVAAECSSLTLGLIVMARSMQEVDDVQEWRQPAIEIDIFPVLKLSYDRLKDPTLRQCFLLAALYPKYGDIELGELNMLFRIEGLLDNNHNIQNCILNKLENVCLLEKQDNKRVKMHNFIRDMAIRITNVNP